MTMNLFDIWGNKDKLAIIDSFITLRNQKYLTLCFHNGDVLRNIEYFKQKQELDEVSCEDNNQK